MIRDVEKAAQLAELGRRHQVSRAVSFSFKDFRERIGRNVPRGLCAGLVQVWWTELRKGKDAIRSLRAAKPSLVRHVLLSQARSCYLRHVPATDADLTVSEAALLEFKYGGAKLSQIAWLRSVFGVGSLMELDLVLHHGLPIAQRWDFVNVGTEFLNRVKECTRPGLHLFLFRYLNPNRAARETGHRSALVVRVGGSCVFYDPKLGELSFLAINNFTAWFAEYLSLQHWDWLFQKGTPFWPPVRIYFFGGRFSPVAHAERIALERRFWGSAPRLQ